MPAYRIYTLSSEGHIHGPPRIVESRDDTEVMQQARQWLDGHPIEVWDEKRKVGRLEPESEGPPL